MRTILEDLYYDNITPNEQQMVPGSEMKKAVDRVTSYEKQQKWGWITVAKKRANGEGDIRTRKDGRWEGRYTAGYDSETGKRIIKTTLARPRPRSRRNWSRHSRKVPVWTWDAARTIQWPVG